MKNLQSFLFVLIAFLSASALTAQPMVSGCASKAAKPYSNCAAVYLNNNMLVNDFSPEGICKVEQGMKGKLQVSTVYFSMDAAQPFTNVGFKVAIKNEKTNTLWMFSDQTFHEIELEKILAKCNQGDKIMLLTVDQQFSLPHHEIEIMWGC